MNILILGSGGREHALAWAIAQNPKCDRLIVAPGNAGMSNVAECAELDPCDAHAVLTFIEAEAIDFVLIGPEAPLAAGVADRLGEAGILCFGPSQAAAKLESSKAFTKEICDAVCAPTAAYAHFETAAEAKDYLNTQPLPIVIKADGLAAGKGVVIAQTASQAEAAIDDMFSGQFGAAGASVVIEEFMTGEEASLFILCDGLDYIPLGTAQDHKRAYDGDEGPNTGGMGAYSPAPVMTDAVTQKALDDIIAPCLAEMHRRATPFRGILYAGLMIENGQPRLVEYNVRFGDPECQVLMLRLGAQILDLTLCAAKGALKGQRAQWANDHAITIVLSAKGYPGAYEKGKVITGLEHIHATSSEAVFHAGTALENGQIVSNGGRVLNVTTRAETLGDAARRAYEIVDEVEFDGKSFRSDIGWRAFERGQTDRS